MSHDARRWVGVVVVVVVTVAVGCGRGEELARITATTDSPNATIVATQLTASTSPSTSAAITTVTTVTTVPVTTSSPTTDHVVTTSTDAIPCNAKSTTMVQTESGAVATTVTYACYDVVGETAAAIRANINGSAARPRDTAGVAHDATTTWRYRLTWSTISTAEGCHAANITPTLTIDYIFPRWVNDASSTSSLATRWAAYISALMVHEQGHQDLSLVTTADAISRLNGVVAPCVDFQSAVQAQIDAATDAGRQREHDYDLQTRHGATQGATFP